jgi:WD40 repeat protein
MNTLKILLLIIKTFEIISLGLNDEISSNKCKSKSNTKNLNIKKILTGHSSPLYALTALKNGNLVSGHQDSTIKIWNLTDASLNLTLSGHADIVNSLVVLENGYLVSGSWDTSINIWDTDNRKLIRTLKGHSDYIRALVSLQNNRLASASDDKTIKIWSPNEGSLIKTLKGHADFVRVLAELPNGDLASGSDDRTIKIWNINEGTAKKTLIGHSYWVSSLVVLSDEILASGSVDFTIKLWNMNDWTLIETLKAHKSPIQFLKILKNGDWASFSEDKTAIMWHANENSIKETIQYSDGIRALTSLPNGDLISGLDDGSIGFCTLSHEWEQICEICQETLEQCIENDCLGEEECQDCIIENSLNCVSCFAEIFDESAQITLPDDSRTIICDADNELHVTVCNFFCRSLFKPNYKCEILNDVPVCNCLDKTTSLTVTTGTTEYLSITSSILTTTDTEFEYSSTSNPQSSTTSTKTPDSPSNIIFYSIKLWLILFQFLKLK